MCVLASNAHSSVTLLCSIIGMLMAKGYMELEETLMQWKQKTHLLRVLEVSVAVLHDLHLISIAEFSLF